MNNRNKLKLIEEANQRLEQSYLKSKGLLKEGKDEILNNLDKVAKESVGSYGMNDSYPMEVTTDLKQQTIRLEIYGDFNQNYYKGNKRAIIQPIQKHIDDYLKKVQNKLDPHNVNFTIHLKDSNYEEYINGNSIGRLYFSYQLIFNS